MSEPAAPTSEMPEVPAGDLLLRRLLVASHRENASLVRRLTQSGEFEIPRPTIARAD